MIIRKITTERDSFSCKNFAQHYKQKFQVLFLNSLFPYAVCPRVKLTGIQFICAVLSIALLIVSLRFSVHEARGQVSQLNPIVSDTVVSAVERLKNVHEYVDLHMANEGTFASFDLRGLKETAKDHHARHNHNTGVLAVQLQSQGEDFQPGIEIQPTSVSLRKSDQSIIKISLLKKPSTDVTVSISKSSGNAPIKFTPDSLTFSPSDYNEPKDLIIISGNSSNRALLNETILLLTAQGGGYNNEIGNISVKYNQAEESECMFGAYLEAYQPPCVLIYPSGLPSVKGFQPMIFFMFKEGGRPTECFPVKLSRAPTDDVTVIISVQYDHTIEMQLLDSLDVPVTQFYFTPSNYNEPQKLCVKPVNNDYIDGHSSQGSTITFLPTGGGYDSRFNRGRIRFQVRDDERAKLLVTPDSLFIDEGDSSKFQVKLSNKPRGKVTVVIPEFKNPNLSRESKSLEFDSSDWATPAL